jgi:hypothetical protein
LLEFLSFKKIPVDLAETIEMALDMSCSSQQLRQIVARNIFIFLFISLGMSMAHGKDLIDMEFCGEDDCYKVHVSHSLKMHET